MLKVDLELTLSSCAGARCEIKSQKSQKRGARSEERGANRSSHPFLRFAGSIRTSNLPVTAPRTHCNRRSHHGSLLKLMLYNTLETPAKIKGGYVHLDRDMKNRSKFDEPGSG